MRADTEQLKRACSEMVSADAQIRRIAAEADRIRNWIRQNSSMDEAATALKQSVEDLETEQQRLNRMALALDHIADIYERNERNVREYAERPIRTGNQSKGEIRFIDWLKPVKIKMPPLVYKSNTK